jgi:hypothetical protein
VKPQLPGSPAWRSGWWWSGSSAAAADRGGAAALAVGAASCPGRLPERPAHVAEDLRPDLTLPRGQGVGVRGDLPGHDRTCKPPRMTLPPPGSTCGVRKRGRQRSGGP